MEPRNKEKELKRYLRSNTDGDFLKCFKYIFYFSAFCLPSLLAASPLPITSFFIALPYLIVLGVVFYKRFRTTAFLALANEAGELEQLLEDFSNAQPILADRLRIGDEWLFGQGMRCPTRIRDISELRYEQAVSFVQGCLAVSFAPDDREVKLCRFTSSTPFEDDIGGLVNYLLKINPNISFDSSLLDLSTHKADARLARKMAARTIHGRWGTCSWDIDENGVLTVHKGKGAPCGGKSPWTDRALQITEANFDREVILPRDCSGLFAGCASLTRLKSDSWNMSQVKSMKRMFCGCSSLKEITCSKTWDTSQVEDMTCTFDGCISLKRVFISEWDTSSVRCMQGMFCECSSLRFVGVKRWNTSQVENMSSMFMGCSSIVRAPVSQWDTAQVKNADWMFKDCQSLLELDLSLWDTGQLADAHAMLDGCVSLVSLTLPDQLAEQLSDRCELPDSCVRPFAETA